MSATQIFDQLQRAGFAGFYFPVSRIEVSCSLRDHVHEYPHSPGGAPEKLGRKLYEFRYSCPFFANTKGYESLWPETLASLRIIFEGGQSFDLVVPTIGTITAYCTAWHEVADPKTGRNGVSVDLTFREDQSDLFLVTNLIAQTVTSFSSALGGFQAMLADQQARLAEAYAAGLASPDILLLTPISSNDLSLFNQIIGAAELLLDAISIAADFGYAVASLADDVVSFCALADTQVVCFQDPTYYPLLDAMLQVWQVAQKTAQDALGLGVKVIEFTVPQPGMSVAQISSSIYGDATHALELAQINSNITDLFLVPGGQTIKAYQFAPSTQQAA